MPNSSDPAIPQQPARRSNATKRLIQAAALASTLIPLGSVPAESAVINCVSQGGSGGTSSCASGGGPGVYTPGSGSSPTASNTWKFFTSGSFFPADLLYTVEIFGDPASTFTLNVYDVVFSQTAVGAIDLSAFPGAQCIPIFDANNCAYFNVQILSGTPSWVDGLYTMVLTWFSNADPVSQPPDNGTNRILKAEQGVAFTKSLVDSEYHPAPTPTDPALGGRGDTFSLFLPTTNVPEPATLMLFGTAFAAALIRRRRRR